MELMKAMETRRSIRSFKAGEVVQKSAVEEMIKAAQLAPTWKNSQTGRYYVVMTPEKLESVIKNTLPEFNQNSAEGCGAIIVTTFVKNRAGFDREGNPDNELGNEWGAYDLGLCNQNMLLRATELGLDTLVMGIRDEKALRAELAIPEEQEVVAVIAVGYRTADAQMPKRKELEAITTFC